MSQKIGPKGDIRLNKNKNTNNELKNLIREFSITFTSGTLISYISILIMSIDLDRRYCLLIGIGLALTVRLGILLFQGFQWISKNIRQNLLSKRIAPSLCPSTLEEFTAAGVAQPIDFCYLCVRSGFTISCNILTGQPASIHAISDPDLFSSQLLIFKQLFGRCPIQAQSGNWITILTYEYCAELSPDQPFGLTDVLKEVTKEVAIYPIRFNKRWDFLLDSTLHSFSKALLETYADSLANTKG